MWRLGFFFHEMAFGLLSVFLPLYVIAIGGSLLDVGIMSSSALFLAIPFSFLWGHFCDKTKRYRRYVLLSFAALSIILYLFTLTTSVELLIILYAFMWIFHVAHEPSKNVLTAELYPRDKWERAFASYEALVKVGWLIGLVLGFLASTYSIDAQHTLMLCSALNFVAFALSVVLVRDPPLVFERSLVKIEKAVDFTYRGVSLASKLLEGIRIKEKLKMENPYAFCLGLALSSLATSMLSTPLPVFFSKDLAVPVNFVFAMFVLNSSGGVTGYLLALNKPHLRAEKARLNRILISRSISVLVLIVVTLIPPYSLGLASLILILLGFTHALFFVYSLSISMELMPEGKAGLFNLVVSVGGACGSFIGPYIAHILGFAYVFFITSLIFLTACIAFQLFS